MRNAGLEEAQAGIKIARRNINNLRFANDKTLMAESEEELKRRLLLGRKVMTNLDSILKKQRHSFVHKDPSSQGYGFSSSHV